MNAIPLGVICQLVVILLWLVAQGASHGEEANLHAQLLPEEKQNLAYRWLNITEEEAARDVDRNGARPTVLSRIMAIWATAMYDAWSVKPFALENAAQFRPPPPPTIKKDAELLKKDVDQVLASNRGLTHRSRRRRRRNRHTRSRDLLQHGRNGGVVPGYGWLSHSDR